MRELGEQRCPHCYEKMHMRDGKVFCRRCKRAEDRQA
jgi:hypothetical protein